MRDEHLARSCRQARPDLPADRRRRRRAAATGRSCRRAPRRPRARAVDDRRGTGRPRRVRPTHGRMRPLTSISNVIRAAPRAARPASRALRARPGRARSGARWRAGRRRARPRSTTSSSSASVSSLKRLAVCAPRAAGRGKSCRSARGVVGLAHQPEEERDRRADPEHLVLAQRARHAIDRLPARRRPT